MTAQTERLASLLTGLLLTILPLAAQSQEFRLLHAFSGADGNQPTSVVRVDGSIYGVTALGGDAGVGNGVLYKVDNAGAFQIVHVFTDQPDGSIPGRLMRAADGTIYGLTGSGGNPPFGTVYKIDAAGNYSIVHSFNGTTEGASPVSLIQEKDGSFLGTTADGGVLPGGCHGHLPNGTLFRMDASGNVTPLHTFCEDVDGSIPNSVVEGADGMLYGTCFEDGPLKPGVLGGGTMWKSDLSGNVVLLHVFWTGLVTDANPAEPLGIIQAPNGFFYGVANQGGAFNDRGAIFRADTQGNIRTIHSFSDLAADGADPEANFVLAADGFFYGTASTGGLPIDSPTRSGVIYRADMRGNVWVLHSYDGDDGLQPSATPELGAQGAILYATAIRQGPLLDGTVARLDLRRAIPVTSLTFSPNPVVEGRATTATVTLTNPAPAGGQLLQIVTQSTVQVPSTVFVRAGETTAQFPVRTHVGQAPETASITAAKGSLGVSSPLAIVRTN